MILHYLKVALRNLLKYKTHSLISAICLGVGITVFSLTYLVAFRYYNHSVLPDYERRIELRLFAGQDPAYTQFYTDDIRQFQTQKNEALSSLAIHSDLQYTEVKVINRNQRESPFLLNYRSVNPSFFSYYDLPLMHGNQLPEAPGEVVISEKFARKIAGEENPVGLTIRMESGEPESTVRDFKVINVLKENNNQHNLRLYADMYAGLDAEPSGDFAVKGLLAEGVDLHTLNKQFAVVSWEHEETKVSPRAISIAQDENSEGMFLAQTLVLFIASLILLSGMINFLKFIIQMLYNRQRELALRKCMGADTKGLFGLLFSETGWMMSFAFLLSLLSTEITNQFIHVYFPEIGFPSFSLGEIYQLQFRVYLLLLLICLLVICIPVFRLRKVSIVRSVARNHKRPVFRNIMIGVQLSISIFFLGGLLVVFFSVDKVYAERYDPLTADEKEHIIALTVNTRYMRQHIEAIVADVDALPDITDKVSLAFSHFYEYRAYRKADDSEERLSVFKGDPRYFSFFRIPMAGKGVEADASGMVYVSEKFRAQLEKDSVRGSVRLDDQDYRIAGTYKALYQEPETSRHMEGSAFFPSTEASVYYFRVSQSGNTDEALRRITTICRRYVPETLPLVIGILDDTRQTIPEAFYGVRYILSMLAVVSLLLVVLSVYSAIAMDTLSRRKEVAIRKINGATPGMIARLFGKSYLLIFLISFVVAYPLLRHTMVKIGSGELECVYDWNWGVLLFLGVLCLLFAITAYKIYRIMHLNPSEILKNE